MTPSNQPAKIMSTPDLFDFTVYDCNDSKVGRIEDIWNDANGAVRFIGITTGLLGLGHIRVVPACSLIVDPGQETVRVPYAEDTIKSSPHCDHSTDLSDLEEGQIYRHFGIMPDSAGPTLGGEVGQGWTAGAVRAAKKTTFRQAVPEEEAEPALAPR